MQSSSQEVNVGPKKNTAGERKEDAGAVNVVFWTA